MRRTVIALVVVLLLVVAAGAGGWWWWRKTSSTSTGERGGRRAATRPVQPLPVADLVLQVDGSDSARVHAGTPVIFTVTLTGTTPDPALRVGGPGKPWCANVRFETPDGKPVAFRIEQLGTPFTSHFPADLNALTKPTPQSDEAIVDVSRVHQVEFGVGPEEAARFATGTLTVRAVLPLDAQSSSLSQLVSNTVSIALDPAAESGQASDDAVKRRLEAAARFYLTAGKWEDAHRVALQLVGRDAPDTMAYTLLGDALDGLRRDNEALAAYHEALAAWPEAVDESPDYLIARMEMVLQRLEASAGKKEPPR